MAATPVYLWRAEALPWYTGLAGLMLIPFLRRWTWTLLLASLLWCWMASQYQQLYQQRQALPLSPVAVRGQVLEPIRVSGNSQRFALQTADSSIGKLWVSWYRADQAVTAGQCWSLELELRPARGSANPGLFDYEAWLFAQRFTARAKVLSAQACSSAVPDWRAEQIAGMLAMGSPRAVSSASALLFGQRNQMTEADWAVLRRTGTNHLFAISGLHIGLFAGMGFFLGGLVWRYFLWRFVPRERDLAALFAACFALVYAGISGFGVPAQRALIMCVLGLLLFVTGRDKRPFSLLGFALCLLLALNPLVVLLPAFWLSCTAVLLIALYLWRYPKQRVWQQALGIQCAMSLCLAPLTAYFFGGVSLLSLPINLILIPAFALILPALMLAFLLWWLLNWSSPLQWVLQGLDGLWWGLDQLATWPWAYATCTTASLVVLLAVCAGFAFAVFGRGSWRLLGLASLGLLFWPSSKPAQGEFRAWFWDVGQGQSVLLQTAEHSLLYDAGPAWFGGFDAGERIVVPAVQAVGVTQVNRLIISHSDKDHAGGAAAVQRAWPQEVCACRRGESWVWNQVKFEILHPGTGKWSDNNGSCVLKVTAQDGSSLLLTGDIEAQAEAELLRFSAADSSASVLSVPHHGSASSSTAPFLAASAARWAIVSAGYRNRWGFPREEVLQRYQEQGVQVLNTAKSGAIRLDFSEQVELQEFRQQQPRLWRFSDF